MSDIEGTDAVTPRDAPKEFTSQELHVLLTERGYNRHVYDEVLRAPASAGGVAIYSNEDFGHADLGALRFFPIGGGDVFEGLAGVPVQLPDLPGEINWRYRLVGVYHEREEAGEEAAAQG